MGDGWAGTFVVETSYAYDGIGRLTDLTHFKDATTFADYGWTYDSFSRVTSFAFSHLVGGSGTSAYTYDNTSQVTGADHSNQTDETYTYDSAGNRTISGYTTGANNRLLSDGVFNFTYDDEGNRLTQTRISNDPADDKTTEYAWDYRNRLTQVVEKNNAGAVTQSILYVYDVWDRRIEKSFDADGAGSGVAVVTRWAYDGDNVLLTVDATGLVTHRYLHGPGTDQILADDYIGAEKYFPLADNLGTVRDIVDHTGAVRNHLVYDAYGKVTSETTAAFDFLYGYTGRERDEDTGLQYNRARYYDAVHGRFISEDWILADLQNTYRYVGNSPTNATDPDGLEGVGHHFFPQKWLKFFREYGMLTDDAFSVGMGYCSGELTGHLNDGFHREYSDYIRDLFNRFYLKRYPNGGAMGAEAMKSFIDSLVAGKNPLTGEVDPTLSRYLKEHIWPMLRGKRFANSMEEVLERGRKYPPAKKFLRELAERAGKRLGRQGGRHVGQRVGKALPAVGAFVIVYFWEQDVEARGYFWGTANSCLDALPFAGWGKFGSEMLFGYDVIETLELDEQQEMAAWFHENFQPGPSEFEREGEVIERNLNFDGDPDAALDALDD